MKRCCKSSSSNCKAKKKKCDCRYSTSDSRISTSGKKSIKFLESLNVQAGRKINGYQINGIIGSGSYGIIYDVTDTYTKTKKALKVIVNEKKTRNGELENELVLNRAILKTNLRISKHLLIAENIFSYRYQGCLVMKKMNMDLYSLIRDFGTLSLGSTRDFLTQIASGVKFLHSNNIIHRDIKVENVLLYCKLDNLIVNKYGKVEYNGDVLYTLCDLGCGCLRESKSKKILLGTKNVRPPEVLNGLDYDLEFDSWSIGCMTINVFFHIIVFEGRNSQEQLQTIKTFKQNLDRAVQKGALYENENVEYWLHSNKTNMKRNPNITTDINDFYTLLQELLEYEPDDRPTMNSLLKQPFLSDEKCFNTVETKNTKREVMKSTTNGISHGSNSRPLIYQASTSTRTVPGGVKETKKAICDSRTGTKKKLIGQLIGDHAHIIERDQNINSGEQEEREELINLDEAETQEFNHEFESKTRVAGADLENFLKNDLRSNSYSSKTVMTMKSGSNGRPLIYQASTSTRTVPDGVKETKKAICDSRTGTKTLIGQPIGDHAHIIERDQNINSGEQEEREELINLDEGETREFNREFESKTRGAGAMLGSLGYHGDHSHRHHQRQKEKPLHHGHLRKL